MPDLLEAQGGYVPSSDRSLALAAPPEWLSALVGIADRVCSKCRRIRPVDEFPIKSKVTGLRRTWCRDCCRAYGREHYRRNRPDYIGRARDRRRTERPRIAQLIDEYLRRHPCVDCGCSDITVLEFDHRDPAVKDMNIGRLKSTATWSRILREIEKCDVRCANCHRRRTAAQFRWMKVTGIQTAHMGPRPGASGRYRRPDAPQQDPLFAPSPDGLRRCSRCRSLKPLADFAFRDLASGARDYYCRPCRHAYRRAHYERNRPDYIGRAMTEMRMKREDGLLLLHEYLRSHPCVDCGEADITVLEFDHVAPGAKTMDVGLMVGRRSWPVIWAEIAKCEVRCANCHRKRTARQQAWKARLAEGGGPYGRMAMLAGVA